jgi:hypothetical protein
MTRRPEITLEFEETVVLKQGGKLLTDFCPRCGEIVDLLSPDVISLMTGMSERHIFQMVENSLIHFVESGRVVACLSCLKNACPTAAEADPQYLLCPESRTAE